MLLAVFMVMIAGRILILNECLCKESPYRIVSTARVAAVERDASFPHRHLRASADPAADQNVSLSVFQKTRKRTVSCAHCSDYLLADDFAVCYIIELELLCSAEMLEDLSVFIGYCNSHDYASFLSYVKYTIFTGWCQVCSAISD